ncbi:MAG: N-acyl homoserine lactonase family protein [Cyclobacteriaceae bacterium]
MHNLITSIWKLSYLPTLLLTSLIACNSPTSQQADHETSIDEAIVPAASELKMYVFTVGDILVKDISQFSPGIDEGLSKQFTNSAYLIRHDKGDLIWDTGLPDGLSQNPDGNDAGNFVMKMPKTMSSQLEEVGLDPSDVDFLGLSHLHGDHIGNANLFTSATLLLQEEEYAGLFEGETVNPNLDSLKNNKVVKLKGDHDVFGDGTVVIKRAVGHTAGHQVLFVNLPETGPIVLSGDLYHFSKNRDQRGVPVFNFDKELSLQAMDSIEKFIAQENATLWIQHDYEQNQAIPHAPEYIK